jgi:hypothetical protein
VFRRGADGYGRHGCVLDERGSTRARLEKFSSRGEALGTGCGDAFGAQGLAADRVGCLWREIGPGRDIRWCGDEVFVFTLFTELSKGNDGAFGAASKDSGSTHKFTPDL